MLLPLSAISMKFWNGDVLRRRVSPCVEPCPARAGLTCHPANKMLFPLSLATYDIFRFPGNEYSLTKSNTYHERESSDERRWASRVT